MAGTLAFACGPYLPNMLLNYGDKAVLTAPEATFIHEIARMKLEKPRFEARFAEGGRSAQARDAELGDLRAALKRLKVPRERADEIVKAHEAEREKIIQYRASEARVVEGLPGEFADYFRGSIAWHQQDIASARRAWEDLLNRSPSERRFKSTWAAFMLGKTCPAEESDKALAWFEQVRTLATGGFADSVGLAAASIGWEAQVHLSRKSFLKAIELYLEQAAQEDATAAQSLRIAARAALDDAEALPGLAKHPQARRVITAFAISDRSTHWDDDPDSHANQRVARWLEAIEAADVTDVEAAEALALAAYRSGQMETAQRWIKRSKPTPVTQWLQAKLCLRDGKVNQAAVLLAKVARAFPEDDSTDSDERKSLAENVFVLGSDDLDVRPRRQILAELGVVKLSRREYTEALDCLLRAGFRIDAAYVAERVLTLEELKSYVDRSWPETNAVEKDEDHKPDWDGTSAKTLRPRIRYLLARRLVRACEPARDYFPEEWRARHDELMAALKIGETESLPNEQRADGWWRAAKLIREHGLELLGTEVEPDWHIHGGNYEDGVKVSDRTDAAGVKAVAATADELARARRHNADPETRFHYRYQAAFVALQAADLLPSNSEEKARILCTAGAWLKGRDPETADIFYKKLVRTCRKTAIGDAADRKRWFPILDEAGNLIQQTRLPPDQRDVISQESEANSSGTEIE